MEPTNDEVLIDLSAESPAKKLHHWYRKALEEISANVQPLSIPGDVEAVARYKANYPEAVVVEPDRDSPTNDPYCPSALRQLDLKKLRRVEQICAYLIETCEPKPQSGNDVALLNEFTQRKHTKTPAYSFKQRSDGWVAEVQVADARGFPHVCIGPPMASKSLAKAAAASQALEFLEVRYTGNQW